MTNNDIDKIELRSEELDAILGKTPNALIRWGISVIGGILLLIIVGSFFFKYPEIVEAPVEITSANPPASLVARSSGKITHIYVHDKEMVMANTVLATIDNTADYEQVKLLKLLLSKISSNNSLSKNVSSFSANLCPLNKLGEIQPAFTNFTKAMTEVIRYYQLNIYPQKIAAINKQIALTNQYNSRLKSQTKLVEQDLRLNTLQHNRDSVLYRNKIIAQSDLESSSSSQIQKKYSFEGAQLSLADSKIKIATLEQQALELRLQGEQEEKSLLLNLDESYKNLLSELASWEQKYVLKSPIDGKVNYTKFWSENQNVNAGEIVLTIIPKKSSNVIGKLNLPIVGAGRVQVGQTALIRMNNYPYMEYGTIKAKVINISMTTSNDIYPVELQLPDGLKTNYNKVLHYSNGMTGVAEIITEDMSLFNRFFNPVKSLFKKHISMDTEVETTQQPDDQQEDKQAPTRKVVVRRFQERK